MNPGTRILTPSRKVGVVLGEDGSSIRVRVTCRIPTTRADAGEPVAIEAAYAADDLSLLRPRPPQGERDQ